MNPITRFIALFERQPLRKSLASLLALVLLAGSPATLPLAHAGPAKPARIAADLQQAADAVGPPRANWVRDIQGVRQVQAIVVSSNADPAMADLQAFVLGLGGTVHAMHPAVQAMTVQLKAGQLQALAQHRDVVSVSPNRVTQRTASTLEQITGALTANVRPTSSKTAYTGLTAPASASRCSTLG